MARKIDRLLKKKEWTGEEIGKLFLANTIDGYNKVMAGDHNPTPLFSQEKLDNMVKGIDSSHEGDIYNRYVRLHDWISTSISTTSTAVQQLNSEIRLFLMYFTQFDTIERALEHLSWQPTIMTSKEFEDKKQEKLDNFFIDADGSENGYNILELVFEAISHFTNLATANPRRVNPIKNILKDYQKQPVESEHIHNIYGEATWSGYYLLEDGRRSDQIGENNFKRLLKDGSIYIQPSEKKSEYFNYDIRNIEVILNMTEEEAEEIINNPSPTGIPATFYYYTEAPEDFMKIDVLEGDFYEFYPDSHDLDDAGITEQAQLLQEEFPELLEAILEFIDDKVFKGDTNYSNTPIEEWTNEKILTYRETYDRNLFDNREHWDKDYFLFDGTQGARHGVAVLNEGGFSSKDDKGYYESLDLMSSLDEGRGLLSLTPSIDDHENERAWIEHSRQLLLSAYTEILIHDTVIDLLDNYLDLDGFQVFKLGADRERERINALDESVNKLKDMLQSSLSYGQNKAEQELKLQVLDEVFYPFNADDITLDKEFIEEIKLDIYSDLRLFDDSQTPNIVARYRERRDADGQ